MTVFKQEYEHIIDQKEVWGFLVKGPSPLDNPVFVFSHLWGEAEPADKPAIFSSLAGCVRASYTYQKRELWSYKYDNMATPKWGDAISASVILQEIR